MGSLLQLHEVTDKQKASQDDGPGVAAVLKTELAGLDATAESMLLLIFQQPGP